MGQLGGPLSRPAPALRAPLPVPPGVPGRAARHDPLRAAAPRHRGPLPGLDPADGPHRSSPAHAQGGRHGQALAMQASTPPLAVPARCRRPAVSGMPGLREAAHRRLQGRSRAHVGGRPKRIAGHTRSLLALATRRPGGGRGCPPQAWPQLLGQHLDGGAGAAILGGPAPLLERPTTTTRLPLLSDCACSAWSRHTIPEKTPPAPADPTPPPGTPLGRSRPAVADLGVVGGLPTMAVVVSGMCIPPRARRGAGC